MAQIRESRFAVMSVNEEDIDLFDLSGAGIVSVESSHQKYTDEFEQEVSQLNGGDIIQTQLQSEDILQPNSIWRFLELEVIGHESGWSIS